MREIKFRAWDNYHKAMCYEVDIYTGREMPFAWTAQWRDTVTGDKIEFFDNLGKGNVLMQFTGLKDKNGKEIYEGDILKCAEEGDIVLNDDNQEEAVDGWIFGQVVYEGENGYPAFELLPHPDMEENALSYYEAVGTIYVIGNIYENPELLK